MKSLTDFDPTFITSIPALSIRQPWTWFILYLEKRIENRDWFTNYRGPFLIHASKGCTRAEWYDAVEFARHAVGDKFRGVRVPHVNAMARGGIVGIAELADCVSQSDSPWFMGEYGFVLRNVEPVKFHQCRGALGFFKPDLTNI